MKGGRLYFIPSRPAALAAIYRHSLTNPRNSVYSSRSFCIKFNDDRMALNGSSPAVCVEALVRFLQLQNVCAMSTNVSKCLGVFILYLFILIFLYIFSCYQVPITLLWGWNLDCE